MDKQYLQVACQVDHAKNRIILRIDGSEVTRELGASAVCGIDQTGKILSNPLRRVFYYPSRSFLRCKITC
jgi:hypothetical protein